MRDRVLGTAPAPFRRYRRSFQAIRPLVPQPPCMRQTIQLVAVGRTVGMCLFPPSTATRRALNDEAEATEVRVTKHRYFAAEPRWGTPRYRYMGRLASSRLLPQILLVAMPGGDAYVIAEEGGSRAP